MNEKKIFCSNRNEEKTKLKMNVNVTQDRFTVSNDFLFFLSTFGHWHKFLSQLNNKQIKHVRHPNNLLFCLLYYKRSIKAIT